ncbi:hypothetical protein JCM8547_002230 [Rhodosporidiobolus lusitaniae]
MRVPHLIEKVRAGNQLVYLTAATAGTAFLFFGYDQGLLGSLISFDRFLAVFPECEDPDVSGITVSIYEVGCAAGAVCSILWGDKMGRKQTIALGMMLIIVGATIMGTSFSLAQLIVGRIITGVGNGLNTATVPTLLSELSPPSIRGTLNLIAGALVAGGICVAYAVCLGFYFVNSSLAWRLPLLGQIVFAVPVLLFLLTIPESPSWLIKHGDEHPEYLDEARGTLKKIWVDKDDDYIDALVEATQVSAREVAKFTYRDLFTGGPTQHLRRTLIGMATQFTQQLTGINIVSYYATVLFESVGLSPVKARIMAVGNGAAYCLCGFAFIFAVEKYGRRATMIQGTLVNGICMICLTALVRYSDLGNKACGNAAIAFIFLYNGGFAWGWLGQGWLYPSEITPIAIRIPANGLSTISNWLINFMVVMVTPPSLDRIGSWTYLIFGGFCFFIVTPILYIWFPETAGRSLEEMDLIIAEAYNGNLNYVSHSLTRPRITGRELDLALQRELGKGKGGTFDALEKADSEQAVSPTKE